MTSPSQTPFLHGKECYLRPLERADLTGAWRFWLNDPEVTRHMFRGAFPNSAEANESFYEQVTAPDETNLVLAIVATDGDAHVGNVGLHRIDWINRSAEFGILIGERDHWGRGIGREATTLIVEHGFNRLNLLRIWLGVFAAHEAAVKLYEAVGFRVEGTLREAILRDGKAQDQLMMSLLAREFRDAHQP